MKPYTTFLKYTPPTSYALFSLLVRGEKKKHRFLPAQAVFSFWWRGIVSAFLLAFCFLPPLRLRVAGVVGGGSTRFGSLGAGALGGGAARVPELLQGPQLPGLEKQPRGAQGPLAVVDLPGQHHLGQQVASWSFWGKPAKTGLTWRKAIVRDPSLHPDIAL